MNKIYKVNNEGFLLTDNIYGVPFKVHPISKWNKKARPGYKIVPKTMTVHNTGNKSKGANADMHTRYVDSEHGYSSWQFTVGENIIYQELGIYEEAYHAGDGKNGPGNKTSLAMELVEVGNWNDVRKNSLLLMKALYDCAPSLERNKSKVLVPHQKWTNKYCPRVILDEKGGFARYIEDFIDIYNKKDIEGDSLGDSKVIPGWVAKELNYAKNANIITDLEYWTQRYLSKTPTTVEETLAVVNNLNEQHKKDMEALADKIIEKIKGV